MITLLLFSSALIGSGLGYGSLSFFHPMLLISLKNFRISNLKSFCLENKPLVFMALYSAASILWSTSARIGVRELALILMGEAVVFFVVYSGVTTKQLFKVLKTVIWIDLFICVGESLSIFRYPFSMYSELAPYLGRNFVSLALATPTGFHYNPNNNALFILIFSPIMYSVLSKKLGWLYLVVSSFVIFMAASKLILIAWIIFLTILIFGILLKKIGLIKAISIFLFGGLLLLASFNFSNNRRIEKYKKTIPSIRMFFREAPALLYSRMKGEEVKIEYKNINISLHERLLLLDGLAKVLSNNWLFGIGGGSLEPISHTQQGVTLSLRMPHFYFLEVLAKYGILFLGAYLYWLGYMLKRVFTINKLFALSLCLFVIFSPVMSSAMYFMPKWALYALLLKLIRENSIQNNSLQHVSI